MEEAVRTFAEALPVWHLEDSGPLTPGEPTPAGATCALHALETGIGLTRTQASAALVTGPVSKHALQGIGYTHPRSEEHTSELQSLMRISYAVFCLKKQKQPTTT